MKKIISIVILILLVVASGVGYYFYKVFLGANINANPESATYKYLYVRPNDTWNDVVAQLDSNGWVSSVKDLQNLTLLTMKNMLVSKHVMRDRYASLCVTR